MQKKNEWFKVWNTFDEIAFFDSLDDHDKSEYCRTLRLRTYWGYIRPLELMEHIAKWLNGGGYVKQN